VLEPQLIELELPSSFSDMPLTAPFTCHVSAQKTGNSQLFAGDSMSTLKGSEGDASHSDKSNDKDQRKSD
jgi:hypothetical protein